MVSLATMPVIWPWSSTLSRAFSTQATRAAQFELRAADFDFGEGEQQGAALVGLGGLRRLFDVAADHGAGGNDELPLHHDGRDHHGFHGILGLGGGAWRLWF